jgi:SAM-dependent methyltransferase
MSHDQQIEFCKSVKKLFPQKFTNVSVLDIGSLDINGNNRYLFENYTYIGVDIGKGKNVDIICRGHEYHSETQFNVVISTECFEHDEFYDLTISNMYKLLMPGGLFLFTCATTGRAEHGTIRSSPSCAPFIAGLNNYYKNLTEQDIKKIMDFDSSFLEYKFSNNKNPCDLYFWGIKNK